MKEVLKYIFGILFIFSSLIALFSNVLIALLLLIAGLITTPFILNFIQDKLNKKFSSTLKYIIVIGCLVFSFVLNLSNESKMIKEKIKAKEEEFSKLPQHAQDSINLVKAEEKAKAERNKMIKSQFMPRSGEHINLAKVIKQSMKNPKSYEHVATSYEEFDTYLIVKTVYRGTNSFGGVVSESIKAKVEISTGEVLEIIK